MTIFTTEYCINNKQNTVLIISSCVTIFGASGYLRQSHKKNYTRSDFCKNNKLYLSV